MAALPWITYLQRMVGRGHPTLSDTLNTPLRTLLSQSGYNPDATTFPGLMGPVFNVRAFGAVGDGVADDTAAIQLAISGAVTAGAGTVYFPGGSYKITSSITITSGQSKLALVGAGRSASRIVNAITGNPANPALLITSDSNYFLIQGLWINGNGLTGASGNGHAIALINIVGGGTYSPQQVMIRDCLLDYHMGTGKDGTGASIPACGVYGYGLTGCFVNNTAVYNSAMGVRFTAASKVYLHQCSFDVCTNVCAYVDGSSEAVDFVGTTFNGSGAGGAKDGLVYLNNCSGISIVGCRLKNGNPYLVNASSDVVGPAVAALLVEGCSCQQFLVTGGHTAFALSNAIRGCVIQANSIDFVNTITDGVGISVIQIASGFEMAGLVISGNTFDIGTGGTLASGVKLNVTSNKVVGPVIEGNLFGTYNSAGKTITSCIELRGFVDGAMIRGNTFVAAAGDIITNAIQLVNGAITNLLLMNNVYRAFGGTITNEISQSGGVPYMEIGRGGAIRFVSSGGTVGYIEGQELSADPAAPATNFGRFYFKDNGSGKTQLVARFPTGAVQVIATEP